MTKKIILFLSLKLLEALGLVILYFICCLFGYLLFPYFEDYKPMIWYSITHFEIGIVLMMFLVLLLVIVKVNIDLVNYIIKKWMP